MTFSRNDAAPVQTLIRSLPQYAADHSDSYDNCWDVTVVWNDGKDYWCFIATMIKPLFTDTLAIVRRELAGTGVTLYARYVPGYDDGGEVEVLETEVL